jgi:hypothetical protein
MENAHQTSTQKFLLYTGLLPLPWFITWVFVGGVAQPGYNSLAQHASELLAAGGFSGACVRIAAAGAGMGFILFGFAVGSLSSQKVSLTVITWVVFGLSMISNSIWPMGSPMHGLYAVGIINLLSPAISHVELERRWLDRPWHRQVTALSSLAGVLYLWLNLTGNDPESLRGLTQRVFFSLFALWPFAISLSLLLRGQRRIPKTG